MKKLMYGNEAIAEAAILAGCRFYAGYPITPQNELIEYMSRRMGEAGGAFVQSESEVAAINMVLGASATGTRAMTSSSSPGVSLKQEGISYLAACQLPAVIVNVQRGGPGLGNIAPAQSDYFQATKGGGHGDYHLIVLAPNCVEELMRFTYKAFDLADIYRTPVMILADAILGQMMEPVDIDDLKPITELPKKPWALTGCKDREPNVIRSLFLKVDRMVQRNEEIQNTYNIIKQKEILYNAELTEDADIILVAYGAVSRIAKAAVLKAREKGIKAGMFRPVTLWPFPYEALGQRVIGKKSVLVTEMSYGQMVEDVKLAVNGKIPVEFYGKAGGWVPTVEGIFQKITDLEKEARSKK